MESRTEKFFGDIISPERIRSPRPKKLEPCEDEELLEVLWDAFNGRGKRAAEPVEADAVADLYDKPIEDEYIADEEAEQMLEEMEGKFYGLNDTPFLVGHSTQGCLLKGKS